MALRLKLPPPLLGGLFFHLWNLDAGLKKDIKATNVNDPDDKCSSASGHGACPYSGLAVVGKKNAFRLVGSFRIVAEPSIDT